MASLTHLRGPEREKKQEAYREASEEFFSPPDARECRSSLTCSREPARAPDGEGDGKGRAA